jgi:tRNA(His) guanylyltransferase
MMFSKLQVNWSMYPAFFKRGTYCKRVVRDVELSTDELQRIPEKHRPKGPVTRGAVILLDMPPLRSLNFQGELFTVSAEREMFACDRT